MMLNRLIAVLVFVLSTGLLKSQETIIVDIEAAYQKGIALMTANQYTEALDHIFECHRSDPDNIDYANRLAYCYYKLGNFREAKYVFAEVLKKDSLNVTALSNLATIAERELNYQNAQKYYGQLIEIDSLNSFYYRQNALIAQKQGKPVVATAFFHQAHTLNEKDIATIADLSIGYLELKAFEYAREIIDKGMALDSSNIRVLYANARVCNAFDDYPGIIRSVSRAMEQGDSTNYYAMMLGVAYLKSDSLEQCIYHFNRIIGREKDSEHTHHYLALAYELKGEREKALEHFELAIEKGISKKVPRYHQDLAELNEKSGNYFEAYHHYKSAYDYKADDELLFHIAHNADKYFKDKKIAMRYYQRYAKTSNLKYRDYATQRIEQLKEIIHQMGG